MGLGGRGGHAWDCILKKVWPGWGVGWTLRQAWAGGRVWAAGWLGWGGCGLGSAECGLGPLGCGLGRAWAGAGCRLDWGGCGLGAGAGRLWAGSGCGLGLLSSQLIQRRRVLITAVLPVLPAGAAP